MRGETTNSGLGSSDPTLGKKVNSVALKQVIQRLMDQKK